MVMSKTFSWLFLAKERGGKRKIKLNIRTKKQETFIMILFRLPTFCWIEVDKFMRLVILFQVFEEDFNLLYLFRLWLKLKIFKEPLFSFLFSVES